jgi:hypothetical protein
MFQVEGCPWRIIAMSVYFRGACMSLRAAPSSSPVWVVKAECSANQGDRRPARHHTRTHRRAHKRLPLGVGLCIEHRGVSSRPVDTSCTMDRGQCIATVVVVAMGGRLFRVKTTTQHTQSDLLRTASEGILRWMRSVGPLLRMQGERPNGSIPRFCATL